MSDEIKLGKHRKSFDRREITIHGADPSYEIQKHPLQEEREPMTTITPTVTREVPIHKPVELESVNHPQHYGGADNPYEAIKVIKAWGLGFNLGNTVKYISRAGRKLAAKEIEDLEKARWYLDDHIKELKERAYGKNQTAGGDPAGSD